MRSVLVDLHSGSWTTYNSLDMAGLSKLNCFDWIPSFRNRLKKHIHPHLSIVIKSYSPEAVHYEVSGHEATIDMRQWL